MTRQAGFSLLELLVAASCTGLLAAGVLTLLAGGAELGRGELSQLEARTLARAAVEAIAVDLERAGHGLEGAREIHQAGQHVPVVEPVADDEVRMLLATGTAIEVDAVTGSGRYRLGSRGTFEVGGLAAGVGLPGGDGLVLLGTVRRIERVRTLGGGARQTIAEIAWAAPEAARIAQLGQVRALVPVTWREFAIQPQGETVRLRRRDDGGRWQPVIERLSSLQLEYRTGLGGGPVEMAPMARVTATATAGDRVVTAERWVVW